jgi:hypothetical protein
MAQLFVLTVCSLLLTVSYITYRIRVPRATARGEQWLADDIVGALVVPRCACSRLTR